MSRAKTTYDWTRNSTINDTSIQSWDFPFSIGLPVCITLTYEAFWEISDSKLQCIPALKMNSYASSLSYSRFCSILIGFKMISSLRIYFNSTHPSSGPFVLLLLFYLELSDCFQFHHGPNSSRGGLTPGVKGRPQIPGRLKHKHDSVRPSRFSSIAFICFICIIPSNKIFSIREKACHLLWQK